MTRLDKLMLNFHIQSIGTANVSYDSDDFSAYADEIGMGKRELDEFWDKIKPVEHQDFSLDYTKEYKIDR